MKTILQINVSANWGSTGKIAEQIGECAQDHAWNSYIAYSRRFNESSSHLIQVGHKFGMYLHVVFARIFDSAGLGSLIATKKFLKDVDRINPDIVHLHNIHGYVINYKLLFEYLSDHNIPVVWTFHDFWAITGHCCHFVPWNCNRWKTGCYKCPHHNDYPTSKIGFPKRNYTLKKRLFSSCNLHIVAVSDWVEQQIGYSFLKNKDICTIKNGIDLNIFHPNFRFEHTRIEADKFVIMGVATHWGKEKGFDDYIKLATFLADDEIIVLVGLDDKQISALPPKIIGLKCTSSQQELAALYTRANVLTILSQAETFGLTAIEGFACGTPAIVYDNSALPSLISPNTGRIVPTNDVCALYDTIRKMKESNFKALHSSDCIRYAHENYNKEKCFEKYIELYENLLQQKDK